MLKRLVVERFTVFESADLEFSSGINVFIGANGTGKIHLMKLAYSMLRSWGTPSPPVADPDRSAASKLQDLIVSKLAAVFRPEDYKIGRLVRRTVGREHSKIELELPLGLLKIQFSTLGRLVIKEEMDTVVPTCIFLPAREVLSIYPGFMKAYQERELAFDETYFDLCLALSGSSLRGPRGKAASKLWMPLAEHLRVKVTLKGDQFFLANDDGSIEAHLAAEGYRKIAGIMHLIANGSLMKNGILFWDEPEANLNPKLIKIVADSLLRLAASGVQIFIASHDYLLTTELSLQAEYQTQASQNAPIRFFAFHRSFENGVEVQFGATLADLDDNPIMEEFAELYQRESRLFQESVGTGSTRTNK